MLREMAIGVVVGMLVFGLPLACGAGVTPLVRCKLEALKILPDDPLKVTPYDAVDLIERLEACRRAQSDGGP